METPYRFYDPDSDTMIDMTDREIRAYNRILQLSIESIAQSVIIHRRKFPADYNWEE